MRSLRSADQAKRGRLLAAAAFASILTFLSTGAGAQLVPERKVIEPAYAEPAGRFLEIYGKTLAPTKQQLDLIEQAFGGHDRLLAARAATRKLKGDQVAENAVRGADGLLTYFAQLRFYRAIFKDPAQYEAQVRNGRTIVRTPEGPMDVPLLAAQFVHAETLGDAGRALKARKLPAANFGGAWSIDSVGPTCEDIPAGAIQITQRDRVFEGVRDGKRVFYGAIGESAVFLVVDEPRTMSLIKNNETKQARMDYPDKARELYKGALGKKELTFTGTQRPQRCSFRLRRGS